MSNISHTPKLPTAKATPLLLCLSALIITLASSAATITGVVTRVSDGDTIQVSGVSSQGSVEEKFKVRLDRIDAPEKDQEWGKESTQYLKDLIYRKTVTVEYTKRDQYGRILGIVYHDGKDINLEMVSTGNAWHYSYFDKTPAYIEAEKKARESKIGLWSKPNTIKPYDWRRRK